jgi:hypothetical protein
VPAGRHFLTGRLLPPFCLPPRPSPAITPQAPPPSLPSLQFLVYIKGEANPSSPPFFAPPSLLPASDPSLLPSRLQPPKCLAPTTATASSRSAAQASRPPAIRPRQLQPSPRGASLRPAAGRSGSGGSLAPAAALLFCDGAILTELLLHRPLTSPFLHSRPLLFAPVGISHLASSQVKVFLTLQDFSLEDEFLRGSYPDLTPINPPIFRVPVYPS